MHLWPAGRTLVPVCLEVLRAYRCHLKKFRHAVCTAYSQCRARAHIRCRALNPKMHVIRTTYILRCGVGRNKTPVRRLLVPPTDVCILLSAPFAWSDLSIFALLLSLIAHQIIRKIERDSHFPSSSLGPHSNRYVAGQNSVS